MNPVRDTQTMKIMNYINYQQVGIIESSNVSRMRFLSASCL